VVFGVSFPFWQIAEVTHIYKPFWVTLPSGIFMIMFALAFGTFFDIRGPFEKFLKKVVSYWLAGGFIIFFTFLLFLFLNIFIKLPKEMIFSIVIILSSFFIVYAYHHASKIFIVKIKIPSSKVSRPYTVVQLSDIHVGSNGKYEVDRIVQKVKKIDFDYLVITGDLIDEDYASYKDLEPLNKITQPIYYITGNHEYYLRHTNFNELIKKTNIHDINNQNIHLNEIDIYGVDEKASVQSVLDNLGVDNRRFNIMLLHEPDTNQMKAAADSGIDLSLAGHTHNGQIFPFTWMVRARYKYLKGLYSIGSMFLYVSQGAGTWGPKMRLGTDNEIIVISIYPR
jgi:hypothetical protein